MDLGGAQQPAPQRRVPGNGAQAGLVEPYTTLEPLGSGNPVDLWKWMAATEQKTGTEVLAIAHNGNVSNGLMFPVVEAFGKRLDRDYVQTRARWEPLYEVTQTKGTGEAHPFLSPSDEFAAFEIWDKGNLDVSTVKTKDMLEYEYARAALKNGLKLESQLGTNPYKFGMIGSSDAHTGLAAMEEDNFFGKTAPQEPNPERMTKAFIDNPKTGLKIMDWEVSASGFAAVWATDNTREAIFDAMKRRETYATTGRRMAVRFFAGWDFAPADATHRMPAATGYAKGVPMGGDLSSAPQGKSPTFLVAALKDAIGANLDRIQVVKGWLDKDGKTQERIYDVVVSGGRKIDADGRCKTPVGNTVDVENATWTNTIGAPELITVWKDPQFDAKQRAFYYARVIEIPTPRWTAYDAKRFGVKPLPGTTMVLQATGLHGAYLVHALSRSMRRFLREPLLHFLILGALLFGLHHWLRGGSLKAADEIVLSRGQVQSLEAQFQRVRQRPPTPEESQILVESWIREEIFYREGLAMGLDRDDPIVRRRVAQKLEFITDGAAAITPTAAELQSWLDAHADEYRSEPRYTLSQIYFDAARHGEKLDRDVAAARRALAAGEAPAGDSTLLPPGLPDATTSEVNRTFGREFADALKAMPVGAWQGPLRSGFGVHLVKLSARDEGRVATLDEVRTRVERDLANARTAEANAAHYKQLRARYTVRIDSAGTPAP